MNAKRAVDHGVFVFAHLAGAAGMVKSFAVVAGEFEERRVAFGFGAGLRFRGDEGGKGGLGGNPAGVAQTFENRLAIARTGKIGRTNGRRGQRVGMVDQDFPPAFRAQLADAAGQSRIAFHRAGLEIEGAGHDVELDVGIIRVFPCGQKGVDLRGAHGQEAAPEESVAQGFTRGAPAPAGLVEGFHAPDAISQAHHVMILEIPAHARQVRSYRNAQSA